MSNDDQIFKNRNTKIKYGNHTISEENLRIKFLEFGEHRSISPSELEYKEIFDDEGCQIILVELFYQSLDHGELLSIFNQKMNMYQYQRAMKTSSINHVDPIQIIQSEEFTTFNPQNSESFLYKCLTTLIGFSLIKKVAQSTVSRNTYYSLTNFGRKNVIQWISDKYRQSSVLFLSLLRYYYNKVGDSSIKYPIDAFPLPAIYIIMKWIEQGEKTIDQLLMCFYSSANFDTIQIIYEDYLMLIENENPVSIKKKDKKIKTEIFQKLEKLQSIGLIIFDSQSGIYDLTSNGVSEFTNICNNFRSSLSSIESDKLITTNPPLGNTADIFKINISLTNNGKIIAENIQSIVSTDEYLVLNLMDDVDYHDEYLLPIDEELKRLKSIQQEAKSINLRIPNRIRKGVKYTLMNVLTNNVTLSLIITTSIILILFSATSGFENKVVVILSIIAIVISPSLWILRDRLMIHDGQIEYDKQLKKEFL